MLVAIVCFAMTKFRVETGAGSGAKTMAAWVRAASWAVLPGCRDA